MAQNPELEALILERADDEDDDALRAVYADWLLDQGDVRGEFASLQRAQRAARGAEASELEQEKDRWLTRHHAALVGSLNRPQWVLGWTDGFVTSARVDAGFTEDRQEVLALLRTLFEHPSATLLEDLAIVNLSTSDTAFRAFDLGDLSLPRLRRLRVGNASAYVRARALEHANLFGLGRLWRKLTNLRSLALGGAKIDVGDLRPLGRLRELAVRASSLTAGAVDAVAKASAEVPLRRLTLGSGGGRWGTLAPPLLIALEKLATPTLRELAIEGCALDAQSCAALGSLKLLPQLDVLDLARGRLDAACAAAFQAAQPSTLKVLDLRTMHFAGVSPAAFVGLARRVLVEADPPAPDELWVGPLRLTGLFGDLALDRSRPRRWDLRLDLTATRPFEQLPSNLRGPLSERSNHTDFAALSLVSRVTVDRAMKEAFAPGPSGRVLTLSERTTRAELRFLGPHPAARLSNVRIWIGEASRQLVSVRLEATAAVPPLLIAQPELAELVEPVRVALHGMLSIKGELFDTEGDAPSSNTDCPLGRKVCRACAAVTFDVTPNCPTCGTAAFWTAR